MAKEHDYRCTVEAEGCLDSGATSLAVFENTAGQRSRKKKKGYHWSGDACCASCRLVLQKMLDKYPLKAICAKVPRSLTNEERNDG